MSETEPSADNPQYSREQVLDSFKKFTERGVTDPRNLDLSDPEVIEANKILNGWREQSARLIDENRDPATSLEHTVEHTAILVDAGFSDSDYLDEVANDWLAQDLQTAIDQGLPEVAAKIQARIDEINDKLAQKESPTPQQEE